MINISGFGLSAYLIDTAVFPTGFKITDFSQGGLYVKDHVIFKSIPLLNGKILPVKTFVPMEVTVRLIPGSPDDINMRTLLNAKRAVNTGALGVFGLESLEGTTLAVTHPQHGVSVFSNGGLVSGNPSYSYDGEHLADSSYTFNFGQCVHGETALGLVAGVSQAAVDFLRGL